MPSSVQRASRPSLVTLLAAAHLGPALAVTLIAALLAAFSALPASTTVLVTGAVLAGQLTIGWGNDLLDLDRDRHAGRSDKPLASGELSPLHVKAGIALALVACVVLSLSGGWRSAVVHLLLVVASGHAYNVGLKATAASWVPYAVAFGSLPAVVTFAEPSPEAPPWWIVTAAAALGVAAHFLNTLPDFEDDVATGVRGLPHRLGRSTSRFLATALLLAASVTSVLGPGSPPPWGWAVLLATVALAAVALLGRGRLPFQAAVAIALLDVALLAGRAA